MIIKPPRELAYDLMDRSDCRVQVAAVIYDSFGIFSWGWNSCGGGYGLHAEAHAIIRSNKKRLRGSSITVAGRRKKSGNIVLSKPCEDCMALILHSGIRVVEFQSKSGEWKVIS